MAEQESIVPVAAIVCFLLGVTTLILLNRSKNRIWMDKLAGLMLGWCLIFFGLRYAAATIQETGWVDIMYANESSDLGVFQYLYYSFTIAAFAILALFPLVYPYPVLQKESSIKLVGPITFVLGLVIVITMMLTDYKYNTFWQVLTIPCLIISIPVYFRFLSEEMVNNDETARRMSLCLLYTSPSPRDRVRSRMPSSA